MFSDEIFVQSAKPYRQYWSSHKIILQHWSPILTGVIPKSLPVLWTKPVLHKVAVHQEIRFSTEQYRCRQFLIVLGFNDTSTLEGHFVSSPREREKRDRRESRGDEREGQGRKRNRKESEETEEIKTFPLYPYPLQG